MITRTLDPTAILAMKPGEHVVLISAEATDGILGRRHDLELRDTLNVMGPGGASYAFLLRRPITGAAYENVLRHGVGGLNIDGCRVEGAPRTTHLDGNRRTSDSREHVGAFGMKPHDEPTEAPEGRWPTNLVLVHAQGCGDVSGCLQGCPVLAMDEASGILKSGALLPGHRMGSGITSFVGMNEGNVILQAYGGDEGGASRFFPQFADEAGFMGWLKALIGDTDDSPSP